MPDTLPTFLWYWAGRSCDTTDPYVLPLGTSVPGIAGS